MDKNEVTKVLQALGDPTRLNIVYLLGQQGPKNVTDISNQIGRISRPAVSHHLKVLKDAEILEATKKGQEVEYSFKRTWLVHWLKNIANELGHCEDTEEET